MLRGLIGFALFGALVISDAQAQEVAGIWAVDFDALITRTADGRDSVAARGKARLVIEVRGDSAFGTWTTERAADQQRKLRGTRFGNAVMLVSDPVTGSIVDRNGQRTPLTSTITYEATVTGDVITGTITPRPHNAQAATAGPRARKFEGKREKR